MNKLILFLVVLIPALLPGTSWAAASSDGFRWFQVEISIFSNDYPEYRDAELWTADRLTLSYPNRIRRFGQIADFLFLEDFQPQNSDSIDTEQFDSLNELEPVDLTEPPPYPEAIGPFPFVAPENTISLPDLRRDPYLMLPPSQSEFQTTNARLERSPNNRLLFSAVWRQPVVQENVATPLRIRGGRRFGEHHELDGSITIRFNENEDRVVIDTNLWITEFSTVSRSDDNWVLPSPPPQTENIIDGLIDASFASTPTITRITQMQQSRAMRSNEFHYLDHPALGVVISVFPYDRLGAVRPEAIMGPPAPDPTPADDVLDPIP